MEQHIKRHWIQLSLFDDDPTSFTTIIKPSIKKNMVFVQKLITKKDNIIPKNISIPILFATKQNEKNEKIQQLLFLKNELLQLKQQL